MIQEEGKHYLYRHIRLDTNEVFYIGVGTIYNANKTPYRRSTSRYGRSRFWKSVIQKTEYRVEILLHSDDYNFIKQKEIEFIALYGRRDLGKGTLVNMTDGGEGVCGKIISEETREKIKKSAKARGISQETRAKINLAISQRDRSLWNMSGLPKKGDKLPQEWKENISKGLKGRVQTQQTRDKCRISKQGDKNPMYNKKGRLHHNAKIVYQYDLDGQFLRSYDCLKEAAITNDCNYIGLCNCCLGKTKTSGGFIWSYDLR